MSSFRPEASPNRMLEAAQPCFDALIQIRRASPGTLPPAPHLGQRFRRLVDRLETDLLQAGVGRRETEDVKYGVVALIDEVMQDPAREEISDVWHGDPLQLHYFDEANAGEGFFDRLEEIRRDPQRADVLIVYYHCLLLGLRGRYVRNEYDLIEVMDGVKESLVRMGQVEPEALSPFGERPPEVAAKRERRKWFLLALPVAVLVVSLGAYFFMHRSVTSEIDGALQVIDGALKEGG